MRGARFLEEAAETRNRRPGREYCREVKAALIEASLRNRIGRAAKLRRVGPARCNGRRVDDGASRATSVADPSASDGRVKKEREKVRGKTLAGSGRTWIRGGGTSCGIPLVHADARDAPALGKRGDGQDVAGRVHAGERSLIATVKTDWLLEEPDPDVGVPVHGETLGAEYEDDVSVGSGVRSSVAVRKGVFVGR